MLVKPIKTELVLPGSKTMFEFIEDSLDHVSEKSIVAITSKVVSLCENRVVKVGDVDKKTLIIQEAEWYCPIRLLDDEYKNHTINHSTYISSSGIDESNGSGHYILWPQNPQDSAVKIWRYLTKRFGLSEVGVIITDSTIGLSRWGAVGIAIGYCGFKPVKDYIGQPDLFGRDFEVSQANIAGGLAATAVLAMGEGTEQTPIVLIEKPSMVEFVKHKPPSDEFANYFVSPVIDRPFAPFFGSKRWLPGGKNKPVKES
jgi:F420-0:gamma-glutamyl ligase